MLSAFLALGIVGGLLAVGYGALSIFAGGMSDDIQAGRQAGVDGLWTGGIGLAVFVVCLGIAIYRAIA